jgi:hypothetical protein
LNGSASVVLELDYADVSANSAVMAPPPLVMAGMTRSALCGKTLCPRGGIACRGADGMTAAGGEPLNRFRPYL